MICSKYFRYGHYFFMKSILLITPPFITPNCPYPAFSFLAGLLRKFNNRLSLIQKDLSVEILNKIFTVKTLTKIFNIPYKNFFCDDLRLKQIYENSGKYVELIDPVIDFLKGKNHSFAFKIAESDFLPLSDFSSIEHPVLKTDIWYGSFERGIYKASKFLLDITYFINKTIDSNFEFNKYAEKISVFPEADLIFQKLEGNPSLIERLTIDALDGYIAKFKPRCVCFTIPFPGCFFSSLKCGAHIKNNYKNISVVFGGGFCNTELTDINDSRIFKCADFISIDASGESLKDIIAFIFENKNIGNIRKTYYLKKDKIFIRASSKSFVNKKFYSIDTHGLDNSLYFSTIDNPAPPVYFWTAFYWNKLLLSNGCYWKKCRFCDAGLDYINDSFDYKIEHIILNIKKLVEFSNSNLFHFTDEAASPKILRKLADKLLSEKIYISYFTNVRFDKSFDNNLTKLLFKSGCVCVTGGLESVTNKTLDILNKGFTIESAIKTIFNFAKSGILVHTYLMYGVPTQTESDLIDFIEIIRQLFSAGLIRSAYLHRFALTYHSEFYRTPEKYGLRVISEKTDFANNDVLYEDPNEKIFDKYGEYLHKAIFNFMNGIGLNDAVSEWFPFKTPKPSISKKFALKIIES